jgi:hypothetical protein
MVIAALLTFAILLVAWIVAPEKRSTAPIEMTVPEVEALAA